MLAARDLDAKKRAYLVGPASEHWTPQLENLKGSMASEPRVGKV